MKLQFLHLSDFHFQGNQEKNCVEIFNQEMVVQSSMLKAIDGIVKNTNNNIDFVVVTGDVAYSGKKEDYDVAKVFFKNLIETVEIDNQNIFIVPGNHDVDRDEFLLFLGLNELHTHDYIISMMTNKNSLNPILEKSSEFYAFANEVMDRKLYLDQKYYYTVPLSMTKGKKEILINIIGLNSTLFSGYKGDDNNRLAISNHQIELIKKELDNDALLNIALMHHPNYGKEDCFHKEDASAHNDLIETADLLLTGHLHHPINVQIQETIYCSAGACYDKRESDNCFTFFDMDLDTGEGAVTFYKYVSNDKCWVIDNEINAREKNYLFHFHFPMDFKKPQKIKVKPEKIKHDLTIPQAYTQWITENYGNMDADKLQGRGQSFVLKLPEIFIPLYAHDPLKKKVEQEALHDQQKPCDIEDMIAKYDSLLIEGHPGSGKTTLMKHLIYRLTAGKETMPVLPLLQDYLPILIYLKDLIAFFQQHQDKNSGDAHAREILKWILKEKMNDILNIDDINAAIRTGKALFLIDGLDEIAPDHRDMVVRAFADFCIQFKNKLVFTGRPHGITGAALNRFNDKRVTIHSLNTEQVNCFINQFFRFFYPGEKGIGSKSAESMIGEIRSHQAIDQLKENPLMLTAICILYHDDKRLPGQRAELYKKFIENLLHRRFEKPELVHSYLKTLAFRMHENRERTIDENEAVEILKEVFDTENNEKPDVYHQRLLNLFKEIEPKCGLLKFEGGVYTFWHLTFQEFLAADYLVDNHSNHQQAIAPYWQEIVKDGWYKEMIELYIGYLSIANKKTANEIINNIMKHTDQSPYMCWCTAALALYDIEKERRDPDLVNKTSGRLLEIIEKETTPAVIAGAGEILGWLGDTRDLKEFVDVRGGLYDPEGFGKVSIGPFELGKYPVTNSWYEEFVNDGGYQKREFWTEEGKKWLEYTKTEYPTFWHERKWKCPNAPVVAVCWYEAAAFCRWLTDISNDGYTYGLPGEKEWQSAAAGTKKREYPWGGVWEDGICNSTESKIEKTSSVGIFQRSNTPDGICDLSGNVWEWTTSDYHSKKDLADCQFDEEIQKLIDEKNWDKYINELSDKQRQLPVVWGGFWGNTCIYCRCAVRIYYDPTDRSCFVGFRCARI